MKRISCFLLLSIFLASCASVTPTTPVITETSAPTATFAFTETPQPTPTTTGTPTETPDPNKPIGISKSDTIGPYIEVMENGVAVKHRDMTVTDANGEVMFHGWVADRMKNGWPVYLLSKDAVIYRGIPNSMPMRVYAADELPQFADNALISHPNFSTLPLNDSSLTLSRKIAAELIKRGLKEGFTAAEVIEKLQNGAYEVTFDNMESWTPGTTVGYNVYIIDASQVDDSFLAWTYRDERITYYSKLFIDDKGNLVQLCASDAQLDQLTDNQIRNMLTMAVARAVLYTDLSDKAYNEVQRYDRNLTDISEKAHVPYWGKTDPDMPFLKIDP